MLEFWKDEAIYTVNGKEEESILSVRRYTSRSVKVLVVNPENAGQEGIVLTYDLGEDKPVLKKVNTVPLARREEVPGEAGKREGMRQEMSKDAYDWLRIWP